MKNSANMKKLLFGLLTLLALGSEVSAQISPESYTLAVNSLNATLVDRGRIRWNTSVCSRFSLPASCTQSQACAAAVARGIPVGGGASCTAAQARAFDIEIFANSTAGRDLYFTHQLAVKNILPLLQDAAKGVDGNAQQVNYCAGNDTVKNAMCAAAGAPVPATVAAGCILFTCS